MFVVVLGLVGAGVGAPVRADSSTPDVDGVRVWNEFALNTVRVTRASDADAASFASYVDNGGTVLVGAYSGIVNEDDTVRLGGYPGAFGDLLGVRIEEFFPLLAGESVRLDSGAEGRIWSERGRAPAPTPKIRAKDSR